MIVLWTEQEDEKLRALYLDGQRRAEIARQMSRTETSIKMRLFAMPFTREELALRKVNRRKFGNAMLGTTRAWKDQPIKREPPCVRALADRDIRANISPRDLTASLQGDPLPGYSALERRA